MTVQNLTLPPDLQAQIAALIQAIPRPRYSSTVGAMLVENGLIPEAEVAELKGEKLSTIQAHRARGKMPPHHKWGSLICYRAADIAKAITAEKVENRAFQRRSASKADILNG